MKALLWKDVRLYSSILIFGAVTLLGPYAGVALFVYRSGLHEQLSEKATTWQVIVETSAYLSIYCSQLPLVMLGAYGIAYERADRSIEFLNSLPPTRYRVLVSKCVVIGCFTALFWGLNAIAVYVSGLTIDRSASLIADFPPLRVAAELGFLCFATGWAASAYFENPVNALVSALPSPLALMFFFMATAYLFHWPGGLFDFYDWYERFSIILAQLFFALGSVRFVRTVEL